MLRVHRVCRAVLLGFSAWLGVTWLGGCSDDDPPPCANGRCVCSVGESCTIPCAAPPCQVDCRGNNPSCRGQCGNGDCRCGPDSHCELGCQSPPCHVSCEPRSECSAVCANGTCSCGQGSSCVFSCAAGPCHVECAGENSRCDGECANGSCDCGPDSTCHFRCLDGNCAASCPAGASCTLQCPDARAGEQGCRFEECAAGEPLVCPGGGVTACNAVCPASG